jgi:hypothetical protein
MQPIHHSTLTPKNNLFLSTEWRRKNNQYLETRNIYIGNSGKSVDQAFIYSSLHTPTKETDKGRDSAKKKKLSRECISVLKTYRLGKQKGLDTFFYNFDAK